MTNKFAIIWPIITRLLPFIQYLAAAILVFLFCLPFPLISMLEYFGVIYMVY